MDEIYIREQLEDWLKDFIEVPNPKLGGWPVCPFSRQARIKNRTEIVFSEPDKIEETVLDILPLLRTKDVVVICVDHTQISTEDLAILIRGLNNKLMPQNVVILRDHPDTVELINDVCMNFGKCAILLVSALDSLNAASDQIMSKGYYDSWTQADIDGVVTWRHN